MPARPGHRLNGDIAHPDATDGFQGGAETVADLGLITPTQVDDLTEFTTQTQHHLVTAGAGHRDALLFTADASEADLAPLGRGSRQGIGNALHHGNGLAQRGAVKANQVVADPSPHHLHISTEGGIGDGGSGCGAFPLCQ